MPGEGNVGGQEARWWWKPVRDGGGYRCWGDGRVLDAHGGVYVELQPRQVISGGVVLAGDTVNVAVGGDVEVAQHVQHLPSDRVEGRMS